MNLLTKKGHMFAQMLLVIFGTLLLLYDIITFSYCKNYDKFATEIDLFRNSELTVTNR